MSKQCLRKGRRNYFKEVRIMLTATKRAQRPTVQLADDVSHDGSTAIEAFETGLGWMAVAWREDALRGVAFGHASRRNAEIALARSLRLVRPHSPVAREDASRLWPNWVKELVDGLQRFAEGEPVEFSDVPIDLDYLTPFGRRVVAACRRITWGKTRSYGELAAECGASGAARAVGTVMAKNRYPLVVPCHRVLAAGGALGGYSAPDGLRMKRRLLALELGGKK
jgi:methylated-DNA-[protein]-cysteine S-methyltransferase